MEFSFFVRLFQYFQEDFALVVGLKADAPVQIQGRLIAGIHGEGQLRRLGRSGFPQSLARQLATEALFTGFRHDAQIQQVPTFQVRHLR